MLRVIAACFLITIAAGPALAEGPVMGSSASETLPAETLGDVQDILVIGDTLGGGLGAGLTRMTETGQGFEILNRFVEDSGIARPEVYDWAASLPKIVEGKAFDAIVVMMGTNDRQTIRTGTLRQPFNTPGWADAYKAQTDRVLDALVATGAKVFWVSLPPMADADFEAAMRTVTAIQKDRVEARGLVFIDIRKAFLKADGGYTDMGADDTGTVRKLRSSDGVTFYKQGNNRLAQLVLAAIQEAEAKPAAVAAKEEPKVALPVAIPEAAVPVFGQWDAAGNPLLIEPKDVLAAMASASSETFVLGGSMQRDLAAAALPGSAAEKLFKLGTAEKPPVGRIDDFSLPPAPAE